jgi:Mg/Co/Ni transporter MgtE
MAVTLAPFPLRTPVTDEPKRILSRPWVAWMTDLVQKVDKDPPMVSSVALTTQAASISATTFVRDTSPAGLYRVSYFTRITRAATTSSSLTVAMGAVNGAVTVSQSGAAVTGNTTSTVQSGSFHFQSDAGTALTYTVTYASSGGTTMQYGLWMSVERIVT